MSDEQIASKSNKVRLSINLSREAVELGQQLAAGEKRSFSNFLEVLIDRESERLARQFSQAQPKLEEVAA